MMVVKSILCCLRFGNFRHLYIDAFWVDIALTNATTLALCGDCTPVPRIAGYKEKLWFGLADFRAW